jgi:beta-galactosidase
MLGLTVEEFSPYSETQTNSICTADGKQFQCTFWGDVIHINSAKTLATFENDYYAGNAAVTKNQFGNGNAFYVGTLLDNNGMSWLTESVCKMAGVQPTNVPTGVELLRRTNGKSEFVFALNYSDQKTTVPLEGSGIDLLTGNKVNNTIELEPKGVAIVQVD